MLDQDDFLRLFLQHQSDIRAFIGSLIRDGHAREDVFQEVSLILWRRFAEFDPTRSFGGWARGIAANKVLQAFDKNARVPLAFSPDAVQAILDAYDRSDDESIHDVDALNRCVEKLPEKSRELLRLRYQQEMKLERIAEAVRSTLHAINMALGRIRTRLAECLEARSSAVKGAAGG
jgi:RNA polymerase sigma-70 factor (ECF subfamily)